MLPRGVQQMRALGRFGRFTLFHHLSHHPMTLAVFLLVLLVFGGCLVGVLLFVLSCFCFLFSVAFGSSWLKPLWLKAATLVQARLC